MIADTFNLAASANPQSDRRVSAHRVALGVAFGMIIGLIPKDSLLVYALILALVISTASLLSALISGLIFSWMGFSLDSFTHNLGSLVLTDHRLETIWSWLSDIPLLPWTRFNNTVVMGNLITATLLFLPVYFASRRFVEKYGEALYGRFGRTWLFQWLLASPVSEEREADAA